MDGKTLKLYMCMIDWQHELGEAADGTLVYPSLRALQKYHACWEECGVIEVDVSFNNPIVVVDQDLTGGKRED